MLKFSELTPKILANTRHLFQSTLVDRSAMVGIEQVDHSTPPNESLLLFQLSVTLTAITLLCSTKEQAEFLLISEEIIKRIKEDNSIAEVEMPKEQRCPECKQKFMAISWHHELCPHCEGAGRDVSGC
jgi:hypothetical protein